MVDPANDAMMVLHCAVNRTVHAARGSGRCSKIQRDLDGAIAAVRAALTDRPRVDLSDPFALIEAYLEAGGELGALLRAVEQRRTMDMIERQAR